MPDNIQCNTPDDLSILSWLEGVLGAGGAKCTGASSVGSATDVVIELEGNRFNVTIKPI